MEESSTPAQVGKPGRGSLLGLLQALGRSRGTDEGPDPLTSAFDRLASSDLADPEPAVARACLALPGVRGVLLMASRAGLGWEPLAAAGLEVPDSALAFPGGNTTGTSPDTIVLAVTVPSWGRGPLHRLAVLVDPSAKPSPADLSRFAAIASPVLGSRPSRREVQALRRKVARLSRDLARARKGRLADRRHALLGRLLDEIASEVAHALATVVGCASALRHETDPGSREIFLSELESASSRACGVYDQIAGVAGAARSDRPGPFAPGSLLEEAIQRTARAFERAGAILETRVEPDLPSLEGSAGLVREAFANVLTAFAQEIAAAGLRRRMRVEARATGASLLVRFSMEGSSPPSPPPPLWPASPQSRVGWWLAIEILRDLGATIRSHGWEEGGVPELLLVLPVDTGVSAA